MKENKEFKMLTLSEEAGITWISQLEKYSKIMNAIPATFGAITTIIDIFNPPPTPLDIAEMIINEIKKIFLTDLFEDKLRDASGILQSAHQFLTVDFANAEHAGKSKEELYDLITKDHRSAAFSLLYQTTKTIEEWLRDFNPEYDQKTELASKGFSLCLGCYFHIVVIYTKISQNNPSGGSDEWLTMQTYAREAVAQLKPLLDSILDRRLAMIFVKWDDFVIVFRDSFYDDDGNLFNNVSADFKIDDFKADFRKTITTGDLEGFERSFNDKLLPYLLEVFSSGENDADIKKFKENYYPYVGDFSKWYTGAKNTLDKIELLSNSPVPSAN